MGISPLNRRRINNFKSNKRGLYSFYIFVFLFIISIFADFISNEKPLIIKYEKEYYFPILNIYSETIFGGDFETEADYRDPYVKQLIENKGWIIMPIIPYNYNTIIRDLSEASATSDAYEPIGKNNEAAPPLSTDLLLIMLLIPV